MNRLKIFLMTFVAVVVAFCGGGDSNIVEVTAFPESPVDAATFFITKGWNKPLASAEVSSVKQQADGGEFVPAVFEVEDGDVTARGVA